jgi:hypothetical protein
MSMPISEMITAAPSDLATASRMTGEEATAAEKASNKAKYVCSNLPSCVMADSTCDLLRFRSDFSEQNKTSIGLYLRWIGARRIRISFPQAMDFHGIPSFQMLGSSVEKSLADLLDALDQASTPDEVWNVGSKWMIPRLASNGAITLTR